MDNAESAEPQDYKVKRNISRRKLSDFFGEQVPVDVSIQEILNHGLKAVLQSNVPLCYFLYCLLEDISAENLVNAIPNRSFSILTWTNFTMKILIVYKR